MNVGLIGDTPIVAEHAKWLQENTVHKVATATFCPIIYDYEYNPVKTIEGLIRAREEEKVEEHLLVVLKGDLPVGVTRKLHDLIYALQHKAGSVITGNPKTTFFFLPNFTDQENLEDSFANPFQIVLGTPEGKTPENESEQERFKSCIDILAATHPLMEQVHLRTYEEAEMIREATEYFYQIKQAYSEKLKLTCEKREINYRNVKNSLAINPRIGSHPNDPLGQDVHL